MAKSIWNADDRQSILSRTDALRPGQRSHWGKMSVSQMVKHCSVAILGATGELAVKPKHTFLSRWPMPQLLIYVLPWPKGAPTAPEFIIEDDGDLDERRAALKATVESLVSRGETQKLKPHAVFGVLSAKDWGALMHRHLDHHLKQFGV